MSQSGSDAVPIPPASNRFQPPSLHLPAPGAVSAAPYPPVWVWRAAVGIRFVGHRPRPPLLPAGQIDAPKTGAPASYLHRIRRRIPPAMKAGSQSIWSRRWMSRTHYGGSTPGAPAELLSRVSCTPTGQGGVAEWRGSGLQSRLCGFESRPHLPAQPPDGSTFSTCVPTTDATRVSSEAVEGDRCGQAGKPQPASKPASSATRSLCYRIAPPTVTRRIRPAGVAAGRPCADPPCDGQGEQDGNDCDRDAGRRRRQQDRQQRQDGAQREGHRRGERGLPRVGQFLGIDAEFEWMSMCAVKASCAVSSSATSTLEPRLSSSPRWHG